MRIWLYAGKTENPTGTRRFAAVTIPRVRKISRKPISRPGSSETTRRTPFGVMRWSHLHGDMQGLRAKGRAIRSATLVE